MLYSSSDMNFLQTIFHSIYSPSFYKKIIDTPVSAAFKYFLLFIFLLSLIEVGMNASGTVTGVNKFTQAVKNTMASYPKELIVTIRNGTVTTNVQEPYTITFPKNWQSNGENAILIDTKTPFSLKTFEEKHLLAWLTSDALYIRQQSRAYDVRAISFAKAKDMTINKVFVDNISHAFLPWLSLLAPGALFLLLVLFYVGYLFKLVYLLFLAVLLWLLAKLLKQKMGYWESYKVGMYGMTLPLLIELFIPFNFPFMFGVLTILVFVINFYTSKKSVKGKARSSKSRK